ncbi:RNA methyltransferase [Paraflavisolibacter sp. H34]|uniref:RNA methyltransferase n=1 Tax=Huijunlia imazamoxiresistens TaxID=3127457 RepID=UPI00301644A9
MRKLSMDELNRKSVEEFRASDKLPVVAVLENIRSAYNVGSLFRTADAFLLSGVYLCGYTAFPPHKEIKKTALGAEDTVPWKHFKQISEALDDLRAEGYRIFSVEQAVDSIPLHKLHDWLEGEAKGTKGENASLQKIAVVFGNEVTGVEQSTIAHSDGCIEIPQLGMKHSLNVATAAGVVLWELVKGHLAEI